MPCLMGNEREESLCDEGIKLSKFLSEAVEKLSPSDLANKAEMTPDLQAWLEKYRAQGLDGLVGAFQSDLQGIHDSYSCLPSAKIPDTKRLIDECHSLTAAVCNAMTLVEQNRQAAIVSPELQTWWQKHKIEDEQRREAENVVKRAFFPGFR
jgi:hypothetical protein